MGLTAASALALGIQTEGSMRRLEEVVGVWATQTFGGSERLQPCLTHLGRELEELRAAAERGDTAALAEEAADMVILLFGLAGHLDFSLTQAFKAKMLRNLRRRWKEPDAEGVVSHAGEGAPQ